MLWGLVHGVSLSCGARVGRGFGHVGGAHVGVRDRLYVAGEAKRPRAWGKHVEGRKLTNGLRPSPRVRPRVYPRAPGCLLVG